MKKKLTFLLLVLTFLLPFKQMVAQTDREIILEMRQEMRQQYTKLSEQAGEIKKEIAEIRKDVAISNAKVEGVQNSLSFSNSLILGIFAALVAFLVAMIGILNWDRRTALKPFEAKTDEIKNEFIALKEKELKLEERLLKSENTIKRIIEMDSRFAGLL